MNVLRSATKHSGARRHVIPFYAFFIACTFLVTNLRAQDLQVGNQFIIADVNPNSGLITVLPVDAQNHGHIGLDKQLSFQYKSYFTCQIGSSYYTNNEVIAPFPGNAFHLNSDGNSVIIKDPNHISDTIRTTWLNKNNVDIIQDVYPIAFTKSGQIVYKWRFTNHNGAPIAIACQYLEDMQITDPTSPFGNVSNDGPIVLTRWQYKPYWEQYPNSTYPTMPWFYIGFLFDLPHATSYDPGLSAMGYLDYGDPLDLIAPFRLTIGDWYSLANTIFGINPNWPVNGTTLIGPDNAVLSEFSPRAVLAGKTTEVGRTSYGTGEYERCIGNLFSIVFYPHHLVWTKDKPVPPGSYSPNPIHIEKFLVNPSKTNSAPNTKITLTVKDPLTLVDSFCSRTLGKSHTKPDTVASGQSIGPGDVAYFDWWACAAPAYFCTGTVLDTLVFTANDPLGPPSFVDQQGDNECELPVTIDCAETDMDPPEFSDTLNSDCKSASINVHDWRTSDRGLKSITWVPENGTDTSKFIFLGPIPPVNPCYNDKKNHVITISKNPADSTVGGCFDFTFLDCLGHQSFHTVCFKPCIVTPHPDSLPPVFTLIEKSGTFDSTFKCDNGLGDNNRVDSFQVSDNNKNDSGICKLDTIAGSVDNMLFVVPPFNAGDPIVRFSVHVLDSMKDGNICIRATDCSKESHYSDTCIHYCTIKDVRAPRITITKSPIYAGSWYVDVKEDSAWDRGIDSIYIVNGVNISPIAVKRSSYTPGASAFSFPVTAMDTLQISHFCVKASDLAGNISDTICSYQGIDTDAKCPNILIAPPLTTNPTSITVRVNDVHFLPPPNDTIRYGWDSGVDSVWFTFNHGMIVPLPISGHGADSIPPFMISVKDTNAVDTAACVTINARDVHGNTCTETYCYPYTQDNLPPVISLHYDPTDVTKIYGVITDSTTYDRGLGSISIFQLTPGSDTNLKFTPITLQGAKVQVIDASNAITRDPIRSSVGSLRALDYVASNSTNPPIVQKHTASVEFGIFVQDFKMKAGNNPTQGSNFSVPVYFVKNDSFPVFRKSITDFIIGFTLLKDVSSISFDSAGISGTEIEVAKWNKPQVQKDPTGTHISISGTMGTGSVLDSKPLRTLPLLTENADSLVMLRFHAFPDNSNHEVDIRIDSIVLNNRRDTLYTGTQSGAYISTALMPAPQSSLSGSTIIITGTCAPILVTDDLHPSSVSLDPPHPNPFTHSTTFDYTVAAQGPVKLVIYDLLGKEIIRIIDQDQKQGHYTVTFDGRNLGGGNYIARLQTGGVVVSQKIGVEK